MHEPTPTSHGALNRFALERLGEMLRGHYQLPTTLPSTVYNLVTKLDRQGALERNLALPSKESRYRRQAVEAMRAAQQTSTSAVKTRLVSLAEAWIELAEKARKDGNSDR